MTRKELRQIFYLSRETEKLQDELNRLRSTGLKSPKLDGMPRSSGGTSDPTAAKAIREAELEKQIEGLLTRIQAKRREIFDFIGSVDDSLLRMIIIYRCVDLCSWEEVAGNIGGPVTAESCRKTFNRTFRE